MFAFEFSSPGDDDDEEALEQGLPEGVFAAAFATGTLTHASRYSLAAKISPRGSSASSTGSAYALDPAVNATTSKSDAAFFKKTPRCGLRAKAVLVAERAPPGPAQASLPLARGAPRGRATERTSVWSRSSTSVALPRWRGSGGGSRGREGEEEVEVEEEQSLSSSK